MGAEKFEAIFGIRRGQVNENCILIPILARNMLAEFDVRELSRGKVYACGNSGKISLIRTGIGAGFAGDAVLWLKETACRNVFLFGSCGATGADGEISAGDLVSPEKCFQGESFSEILAGYTAKRPVYYPDAGLFKRFMEGARASGVRNAVCHTLGSLKLEEDMADYFRGTGAGVVDMECSGFFSAAARAGLNALALFYVTDIIHKQPYYDERTADEKSRILSAAGSGARLLKKFIEQA